jgi:KUP system potassium uptake protein
MSDGEGSGPHESPGSPGGPVAGKPPGEHGPEEPPGGKRLLVLSLAAVGVVYGDIGTSPIYAFRESLHASHGIAASTANVLGVLSLIFWSLIVVISVKYLGLVMQADNRGEGGVIALTALIAPPGEEATGRRRIFALLGLFGAALLYGDSVITPAISVLSAVEGLEVATTTFEPFVIPITVGILLGLFLFQRRGTEGVGAVFGPVTLVWFLTLGMLGLSHLVHEPGVFRALNPLYGLDFFARNGMKGFLVLGSVFLVVTGGEALYADMGHFGTRPIRLTWFGLVLPCLLLNYFGQGAMLLGNPEAVRQPFFLMAPGWALYPLVGLTTAATIIASQAVISGAFSLTRQAVGLGYFPRLEVEHTSQEKLGQIYLPAVNWALMIGCIGLVLGFRTSSDLAAAYGVAVTTDMVFTTVLFAIVARDRFEWALWGVGLLTAALLSVDLSFWLANLPKIPDGGWFPLVVAGGIFLLMVTWKRGRRILSDRLQELIVSGEEFHERIRDTEPERVPGTAVFMDSNPEGTPMALVHNLEHNRVLHERVVILTVFTREAPYLEDEEERLRVRELWEGEGIYRAGAYFGFAEDPNIPALLERSEVGGEGFDISETTFFLGRETLLATDRPGMAKWRERIFALMSRNAERAARYFHIPSDRVVEVGTQVEL